MIKQEFIVDKVYWKVYVYYDVTPKDAIEIITKLQELKLPKSYITSAYTTLISNKLNQGLTETNSKLKQLILVNL